MIVFAAVLLIRALVAPVFDANAEAHGAQPMIVLVHGGWMGQGLQSMTRVREFLARTHISKIPYR